METNSDDFCCPACLYPYTNKDEEAGYYSCPVCGEFWAFDKDDPDYDEHEHREQLTGVDKHGGLFCPRCDSDNTCYHWDNHNQTYSYLCRSCGHLFSYLSSQDNGSGYGSW